MLSSFMSSKVTSAASKRPAVSFKEIFRATKTTVSSVMDSATSKASPSPATRPPSAETVIRSRLGLEESGCNIKLPKKPSFVVPIPIPSSCRPNLPICDKGFIEYIKAETETHVRSAKIVRPSFGFRAKATRGFVKSQLELEKMVEDFSNKADYLSSIAGDVAEEIASKQKEMFAFRDKVYNYAYQLSYEKGNASYNRDIARAFEKKRESIKPASRLADVVDEFRRAYTMLTSLNVQYPALYTMADENMFYLKCLVDAFNNHRREAHVIEVKLQEAAARWNHRESLMTRYVEPVFHAFEMAKGKWLDTKSCELFESFIDAFEQIQKDFTRSTEQLWRITQMIETTHDLIWDTKKIISDVFYPT